MIYPKGVPFIAQPVIGKFWDREREIGETIIEVAPRIFVLTRYFAWGLQSPRISELKGKLQWNESFMEMSYHHPGLYALKRTTVILESIPRAQGKPPGFSILAYIILFLRLSLKNGSPLSKWSRIDRDPWISFMTYKQPKHYLYPFGGEPLALWDMIWFPLYEEIGQIPHIRLQTCIFVYESYMVLTTRKKKRCLRMPYSNPSQEDLEKPWTKCLRNYASLPKWIWRFGFISCWLQNRISPCRSLSKCGGNSRGLIRNGDMFQCVLSQRFSRSYWNPFDFSKKSPRPIHRITSIFTPNLGLSNHRS